MKKFIRYLKLRRQSPSDREEYVKRKQRYEVDFNLEPFAGLTPEYMEMSESHPEAGLWAQAMEMQNEGSGRGNGCLPVIPALGD